MAVGSAVGLALMVKLKPKKQTIIKDA